MGCLAQAVDGSRRDSEARGLLSNQTTTKRQSRSSDNEYYIFLGIQIGPRLNEEISWMLHDSLQLLKLRIINAMCHLLQVEAHTITGRNSLSPLLSIIPLQLGINITKVNGRMSYKQYCKFFGDRLSPQDPRDETGCLALEEASVADSFTSLRWRRERQRLAR